jgi:hypothetical protein
MNLIFEWKKEHDSPTVWKLIDNRPDASPREVASVFAGRHGATWRSVPARRSGEEWTVELAKRCAERAAGVDQFMRDNEREVMEWKVRQCWQPARPEGQQIPYPVNSPHLLLGGPAHLTVVPMWRLGSYVVTTCDEAARYRHYPNPPDPIAAMEVGIRRYWYHPELHGFQCRGVVLGALRVGVLQGADAWDAAKMLRNPDILEALRAIEG